MQIRVEVNREGMDRLLSELRPKLAMAVRTSALSVETRAKRSIQTGSKTGRIYRRGRKTYQASAPGEAPATDTGLLVNSIQTQAAAGALEATVSVGARYGLSLEMGTSKMAARPFLTPAVEAERTEFVERIKGVLEGR